jgi:sugar-phosphatase
MTGAGGCAFAPRRSGADLLVDACGLLVDLDGTLVDSTVPVHRAWSAFAARHRLDPAVVIRFAQGRPAGETVRRLIPASADPVMESALVDHAELRDTTGVKSLPGAAALLAGTTPVAIVTSCSRALATVRLAAAGLPTPAVLVSCDDVVRGKPDPACFRLGARRLGVPIDRCVALEDAPAGVSAARAAGARVIALRTTHPDAALAEACAIVDNLGALFVRPSP